METYSFAFSDKESFNGSIIDDESALVLLPEVRDAWETDEKCRRCLVTFGIAGIGHTKKLICRFCYRGVCSKCLNFAFKHPETNTTEKMCTRCHNFLFSFKDFEIFKELEKEKAEILDQISLASIEKQEVSNLRKDLKDQIEAFINNSIHRNLELEKDFKDLKSKNLYFLAEKNKVYQKIFGIDASLKELDEKLGRAVRVSTLLKENGEMTQERQAEYKEELKRVHEDHQQGISLIERNAEQLKACKEKSEILAQDIQKYFQRLEGLKNNHLNTLQKVKNLELALIDNEKTIKALENRLETNDNKNSEEYSSNQQETLRKLFEETKECDLAIKTLTDKLESLEKSPKKFENSIISSYCPSEILASFHTNKSLIKKSNSAGSVSCKGCSIA
jgi:chromosome segregation ATPase